MSKHRAGLSLLLILVSCPTLAGVVAHDSQTSRYVLVENGTMQLRQSSKGAAQTLVSVPAPPETPYLRYTQYCGFIDVGQKPNEVFIGLAQETDSSIDDVVPQRVWRVRFAPPDIKEEEAVSGFLCDNPWAPEH